MVWVDRNGAETPISADRAPFRTPRLSPDGKFIAVAVSDATRRSDIWIYNAEGGAKRRLTTEGHNLEPVWTPDGMRLTFSLTTVLLK
jgi:Tol biopolymer transport system component